MPGRLLRSHRLRWAAALLAVYLGVAIAFPPLFVAQFLTATLLFIAAGVIAKYFWQVLDGLLRDDYGPTSQLATGIFVGFLGLEVALIWAIGERITGWAWMRNSVVTGGYLLAYNVAGILHITARRTSAGSMARADILTVIGALALGAALGIYLLLNDQANVLRPTVPPAPPPAAEDAAMGTPRSLALSFPKATALYEEVP